MGVVNTMGWERVKDDPKSTITGLSWDDTTWELAVRFASGNVYRFASVPKRFHTELSKSKRKAKYVREHLIGRFDFTREPAARQVPKGKKRPKGWGTHVTSAEEIEKRLRTDPPRPPRKRRPRPQGKGRQ